MNSFTNDTLYTMLLHRLRKDRKGAVSPEEFESFLRWRNVDYYNKMFKDESSTKYNEDAIRPFLVPIEAVPVTLDTQTDWYVAALTALEEDYGHWANIWFTEDTVAIASPPSTYARPSMTNAVHLDIVSETELPERLTNAITAPSATYPVGSLTNSNLYLHGVGATGFAIISYYKLPTDPYFDYYTDASGNITYLEDTSPVTTYLLAAGEIARDGSVAGETVNSSSEDLAWGDDDALNILDMIVSDVSIALSDPSSFQASLLERKENN